MRKQLLFSSQYQRYCGNFCQNVSIGSSHYFPLTLFYQWWLQHKQLHRLNKKIKRGGFLLIKAVSSQGSSTTPWSFIAAKISKGTMLHSDIPCLLFIDDLNRDFVRVGCALCNHSLQFSSQSQEKKAKIPASLFHCCHTNNLLVVCSQLS